MFFSTCNERMNSELPFFTWYPSKTILEKKPLTLQKIKFIASQWINSRNFESFEKKQKFCWRLIMNPSKSTYRFFFQALFSVPKIIFTRIGIRFSYHHDDTFSGQQLWNLRVTPWTGVVNHNRKNKLKACIGIMWFWSFI